MLDVLVEEQLTMWDSHLFIPGWG